MTVGNFLASATRTLNTAGIETARLDCLILLEDALATDRSHILAHLETEIPRATEVELNTKIVQRATHLPLAYLRGKAMFYGREFKVTPDVLVPRPESESMITLLKTLPLSAKANIADIGTGTGCLGITAALELASARVWLVDIDNKALAVAKDNAVQYGIDAPVVWSDLLSQISADSFEVILANLPYVPEQYPLNKAAEHEPKLAIFAGQDGLDVYRHLWQQIGKMSRKPRFVITESLASQHAPLTTLAENSEYSLLATEGLAQCFQTTQLAPHQA